jgi:hypothetical protein
VLTFLNHFFADTLGVVYRAITGRVDPWMSQEIRNKQLKLKKGGCHGCK